MNPQLRCKVAKPKKISREQWLAAVAESAGVVNAIAARKAHAWLQEAFDEALHLSIDQAEKNILAAIASGNLKVTMWFLERKGKARGWGKEIQIESESLSSPRTVILRLPDNGRTRSKEDN
jgi:hypothetical protein